MPIRNARKEKRMSVEELAERASTSLNFVRRVEKGGLTAEPTKTQKASDE
jgi:ribosome-binding protein aMBF1 (putative translation factor)